MRIAPLADVKARLSAYLEQCETEGPVVITRNGRAAALLLTPANDEDLENLLLARSPRLQALLTRSRESIRAGKGLSSKEFWKAVAARPLADAGKTQKRLRSIRRRRSSV
jgi:prevent-host-death family protein